VHESGNVETRILVKTLPFKLAGVAEALADTLPHTPADAEAKEPFDILKDTLAGLSA